MVKPVVVISANAAWNLTNFRSGLITALVDEGYEMVGAAPPDAEAKRTLAEMGCRFHALPVDSKGVSIGKDWKTLAAYDRLFAAERPLAFLGFTIKPNIYGSLAAARRGVPAVNNISGLGTAFIKTSWLTSVVRLLYRSSLARSRAVLFQNADDRRLFLDHKLVRPGVARLLPGSGVDLDRFTAAPPARDREGGVVFLMIARLLRDKGVIEFVEAARRLKRQDGSLRFQILGFLDAENRTAIPRAQVESWVAEEIIEYLGAASDVRPFIEASDCVVLPSYREGTSRVLLEAAAMARPLVASDVPGCREVVEDGINGLLCRVRDSGDLAAKLAAMASLAPERRREMGLAGRRKVEREFDERIVLDTYRTILRKLLEEKVSVERVARS